MEGEESSGSENSMTRNTFTVWLVYRPQKPRFTVVGVAQVFHLNTNSPPFLSTSMQFSVVTTNPNKRVSIFYDHLSAFVSYHNQMITQPVMLPSLFHEKHSTVQLAPILGSGGCSCFARGVLWVGDGPGCRRWVVALRLILLGKLRWKTVAITTRRYGIYVICC
ncbi:late embryogenesis abundant (LEA) hydroxyproline-rich glycoprotein family [Actinidia rufa]|uniref:Late embryogenesis abundant (LEA) hydroxyproline-rich glycoprotein family n=1 Tax=Actinidia rufa TaxID=165716 RepID=A0A7J0F4E3_9ERIC|nr:late embryogenesis abundant (LEA) hydroxyproline-rich glycoprotein family [Actinidia rufa]